MNAEPSSVRARGRGTRRRIRVAFLLAALALASWAFFIEPARLERHDVTIASTHWAAGAAPFRAAVIGDIHAGAPYIDTAKLDRLVAMTNGGVAGRGVPGR
jgi:uncharacterized protein